MLANILFDSLQLLNRIDTHGFVIKIVATKGKAGWQFGLTAQQSLVQLAKRYSAWPSAATDIPRTLPRFS